MCQIGAQSYWFESTNRAKKKTREMTDEARMKVVDCREMTMMMMLKVKTTTMVTTTTTTTMKLGGTAADASDCYD